MRSFRKKTRNSPSTIEQRIAIQKLQGPSVKVKRVKTCKGPLPNISTDYLRKQRGKIQLGINLKKLREDRD